MRVFISRLMRIPKFAKVANVGFVKFADTWPHWVVQRKGVSYSLDIRELIDGAIFLGGWERRTLQFLERELSSGETVVEVGANVGAHSLAMGRLVGNLGTVIAIEPTKRAVSKLRANCLLNPRIQSVQIHEAFVGDKEQVLSVDVNSFWSFDGRQAPENLEVSEPTVDMVADSCGLLRLDLLKIDVDGFDFRVLVGAEKTISKHKPVVLIELCEYALRRNSDSLSDIFEFFQTMGYVGYRDDGCTPLNLEQALGEIGLSISINGVFRHEEARDSQDRKAGSSW